MSRIEPIAASRALVRPVRDGGRPDERRSAESQAPVQFRDRRRRRRSDHQARATVNEGAAQAAAFEVHRLVKTIIDGLFHQRMVGNADIADNILSAGRLIRKNSRHQIVGAHALNVRRYFLPTTEAKQGERAPGVPSPPRSEKRRRQNSLFKNRASGIRVQEMKDIRERKTVLFA